MNTRVKANATVGRDLRARRNTKIKRIFISGPISHKATKGTEERRTRTRSHTRTRKKHQGTRTHVSAVECYRLSGLLIFGIEIEIGIELLVF